MPLSTCCMSTCPHVHLWGLLPLLPALSISKAAISKYEIYSVPFGFLCVISHDLTSRLHSCFYKIVSRSSLPPIHTLMHPYSDAYMNSIYAEPFGISSVNFSIYAAASCSICRIPSTYCLTAVEFSRFTQYRSPPNNAFTCMNSLLASGIPIVAWKHFPMIERNILKSTRPFQLIYFRACNIFSWLSGDSSMQLSAPSKIHPSTYFLVSHIPSSFSISSYDIGSGLPSLVNYSGVKTVCIPWRGDRDRCSICSSKFVWQMLMN